MAHLYPEIGLWRISQSGELDKGNDGILWDPKTRVLAIADGITGLNGKGQKDLKKFGRFLELEREVSGPLLCFRRAFYGVLGNGGKSTFVGVEIPDDGETARVLHAGDSVCGRFRDGVLEILTPQHTAWNEMVKRYSGLQFLETNQIASMSVSDVKHFAELVELAYNKIFDEKFSLTSLAFNLQDERSLSFFKRHLLYFIQNLKSSMVLDLGASANEVRSKVGEGIVLPVQENDIFVLHTDGMNLSSEEVEDVLKNEPPERAARILVEKSTSEDDRAVGVIRLAERSLKTESRKILRKSIQAA